MGGFVIYKIMYPDFLCDILLMFISVTKEFLHGNQDMIILTLFLDLIKKNSDPCILALLSYPFRSPPKHRVGPLSTRNQPGVARVGLESGKSSASSAKQFYMGKARYLPGKISLFVTVLYYATLHPGLANGSLVGS